MATMDLYIEARLEMDDNQKEFNLKMKRLRLHFIAELFNSFLLAFTMPFFLPNSQD